MLLLHVKEPQTVKPEINISFLWGMAVTLIEFNWHSLLHIQVCAAIGCISQSWMLCVAIGWAPERAMYCAERGWGVVVVVGGVSSASSSSSSLSALSHSTSVVSRMRGWAERSNTASTATASCRGLLLHGGEEGERGRVGEKRVDPHMKREQRGEGKHRRSKSAKWKELIKQRCWGPLQLY